MPDERSRVLVPGVDPGADGRFELLGRSLPVRAATEPLVRQLREPPLDEVHPRRVRRREVEMEAWVAYQPTVDLRRLVRCDVVEDEMNVEAVWNGAVDEIQEPPELIGPVAFGEVCDHLARCDVERCVEVCRAVAHVV